MRKISYGLIFVSLVFLLFVWHLETWRPIVGTDGMIHHPIYGEYPAVVPFEQGMTIYPGQSAIVGELDNLEGFWPPSRPDFSAWSPGHRFRMTKEGWQLEKGRCGEPGGPLNCMD